MNHFWNAAIKPILEAVDPAAIVEIGVASGDNTRNILEMSGSRAVLHAIDPFPRLDVDQWLGSYPGRLVFHRDISLNVIPTLPPFQVGLIDGDHNWYTVFNEFRLIAALHGNDPDRFPVLLFHDVGWPYGRRDLYYAHDRIPPEYRHPSARKGMRWGQSELAEEGGLNPQLDNALIEGGERNGVLTAIEDAMKQTPVEFDFIRIPAYFGLAILATKARRAACPALGSVLDEITSTAGLLRFLEMVEESRARVQTRLHQEIARELQQQVQAGVLAMEENRAKLQTPRQEIARSLKRPQDQAGIPSMKSKIPYADLASFNGEEFIENCYLRLLHRQADPSGKAHFLSRLEAGEDKAIIIGGILRSNEGRRVGAQVNGFWLRYILKRLERMPVLGSRIARRSIDVDQEWKAIDKQSNAVKPPRLSVIVVVHNMLREARRTLHSLSRKYQRDIDGLDYEVIVVDNGSSEPIGEEFVRQFGENFSYLYLENPPKSPARAINTGAAQARGETLCIMIDGAHVLTPGILQYAMKAFAIHANPVVAPRYWFTGPGQQGETVQAGYDAQAEDRLFERIGWPGDGYRLFEIGVFITPNADWMSNFFESNCLFMRRAVFDTIGGANESFDYPGGGFLNLDLMREAAEHEGITLVTLLGEATFHQVHGGITTNVAPAVREERVAMYREQYRKIRGREYQVPGQPIEYLGHRPDFARQQLAFKNS